MGDTDREAQEEPLVPGLSPAAWWNRPAFSSLQQPVAHTGLSPATSPPPPFCQGELRNLQLTGQRPRPWPRPGGPRTSLGPADHTQAAPALMELKEEGGRASDWPPALETSPSCCLDKLSLACTADGRLGSWRVATAEKAASPGHRWP